MTGDRRFAADDFPDDSVAIIRTPSGAALALPNSARRLDEEGLMTVRELQSIGHQLAILEGQAETVAAECRASGVSWSLIGWCLGLTGEAARRRYGDA